MDSVNCTSCRASNPASASFCSTCGAALPVAPSQSQSVAAPPSGWALATAGMDEPPAAPRAGALGKDDYASWGARLGGAILDGILYALALFALFVGVMLVWWLLDGTGFTEFFEAVEEDTPGFDEVDALLSAGAVLYGVTYVLWEVAWVRSRFMGKPGQRAAGFKVVDGRDVSRVGLAQAFGRVITKVLLSSVVGGLTTLASAFTIGLSDRRQAIHDMVSSTVCVRTSVLDARGVGSDRHDDVAPHSPLQGSAAPASSSAAPGTSGAMPNTGPFV